MHLFRDGWSELHAARIEPVLSGFSDASVYRVTQDRQPLRYLKLARNDAAALLRDEIARSQWLAALHVPVPVIRRIDDRADRVVLLSDALPGLPADDCPLPVERLVDALAASLAALHALPVADCPFDETLTRRLSRATAAVAAGDVDPGEFATRNIGADPAVLLARLATKQPEEDLVVVHGDATLSNMIVDDKGNVGFVDCGNAGRGDRYIDLAVVADGFREQFAQAAATRFAKAYGRPTNAIWDAAKARYFLDLYELF
jgi:aminoglycoside 3'-phosphotransferase-2